MNILTVLNVAIGLIFIYLIISLIASQIQELISTVFGWRAKHLKEAITIMFGENSHKSKLTQLFFEHPRIQSLNQNMIKTSKSTSIHYISHKKFSNILIEFIKNLADKEQENIENLAVKIKSFACSERLKTKLIDVVKGVKFEDWETDTKTEELQQQVEEWFNSEMEMVSETYKQNAKLTTVAVALTIVIMFNVDTVHIVHSLYKDQTLSSIIKPISEELVASHYQDFSCLQDADNQVNKASCLANMRSDINNIFFENIFDLPIGWNLSKPLNRQFNPLNIQNIIKAIIGWLLSALAISMGAPFWFDMLSRVINISKRGKNST